MPNSSAGEVCSTVIQCQTILQFTLAELEDKGKKLDQATKDKQEVTRERDQLQSDRDTWKNLYMDEKTVTRDLTRANLQQQMAITTFQSQKQLDESMIKAQSRKIRWLKFEKYVYSGAGFGGGFALGYTIGNNKTSLVPATGFRLSF